MYETPPVLTLRGLSKRFGPLAVLNNVALTVERGEVHCVLGENGAGKSTLCNVIFGVHQGDAGEMQLGGRRFRPSRPADSLAAGVAMVHQHFSIIETMTVVDNLMMGQTGRRLRRKTAANRIRVLSEAYDLAVDPEALVENLSVGERQRVEFVKCFMHEPRLLLLDEPTAVLPPLEVRALLAVCRKFADQGHGVILVTHKLAEIAELADRVTVLRAGDVVDSGPMIGGDMRRFVSAMIGRDVASLNITLLKAIGDNAETIAEETLSPAKPPQTTGEGALTVEDVSFHDKFGVKRLDAIRFEVGRGEIVGIAGVEGNGQRELGAILAGLAAPSSGAFFVAGRELTHCKPKAIAAAGVGIVPEDRHASGCILSMSVAENLFLNDFGRFSSFGFVRRRAMIRAAAEMMQKQDVRAQSPEVRMSSLSGGNQQRAILARELSIDPLVLLLAAHPTRGLDIAAVGAVYERIRSAREAGVGVLLISSDLDELIAVTDRILVIFRGRIIGEHPAHRSTRRVIGQLMTGQAPKVAES
jgi:general nucleoside transport system ATP-binding protein